MPRARRVHFNTVGHVLTEMGRKYRAADQGAMQWPDAAAAVRILREIRMSLEGSDFEARIVALEAALADHRRKQANGHGSGRVQSAPLERHS